jgi:hypothetical protein
MDRNTASGASHPLADNAIVPTIRLILVPPIRQAGDADVELPA